MSSSTAAADVNGTRTINLISSDGEIFVFSSHGMKISSYVKSFVEENPEEQELSVPLVEAALLTKIIAFVNHHETDPLQDIPKPLTGNNIAQFVQEYYATFINELSREELAQMASAANFMGIAPLVHLCAAKIASLIRNKTPAEIRTNLGLSLDFTPEQAAKIAKENEWAKDL